MTELPSVRITNDDVYFGDQKIPGIISKNGITVQPGGGSGVSRLFIEFLVGEVIIENTSI